MVANALATASGQVVVMTGREVHSRPMPPKLARPSLPPGSDTDTPLAAR